MSRRWNLFFIILLGVFLRGLVLLKRGSFEFDEAFSTYFAAMDLNELWAHLRFENNPPGYFVLLHFWMQIFGTSDLAARTLSMLFGIAAIPLLYVIGKRLAGKEVGLFSAFLLAISTLPVFYSTEARMYAMYLFLALGAVWFYLKLEERREKNLPVKGMRVGFFLVCSLLVWTHITAWMILLALGIYLFYKSRWSISKCVVSHRNFFIILILLIIQLLPWLVTFVTEKFGNSISGGYLFYIPPDRNYFVSILETFLIFGQYNAWVATLLSIIGAGLLFMAFRRPWSRTTCFLASWLFIPLLIGFMFSSAVPRYFIAVAPAWYLVLGVSFPKVRKYLEIQSSKLRRLDLVILLFFGSLILTAYSPLMQQVTRHWDDLTVWIEHQSAVNCERRTVNCLILVHPHSEVLAFEHYYRGKLPVVGFYPEEDLDSRDLRLVKTNWKNLVNEKNIRALADKTARYNKVFLIFGETDRTSAPELVSQWFWENGWVRKNGKLFGSLQVITLVKAI